MNSKYKIIGFDADDTLWVNEPYFHETEENFIELMSQFGSPELISKELYKTEMANLTGYGYGIKGFTLSMIETAVRISGSTNPNMFVNEIIGFGKALIDKPVILLNGVVEILKKLKEFGYRLIIATKGDLKDQERKLSKSGLSGHFHHIEIMSDKRDEDYLKLLSHLEISPEEFLMIGNSLRSDIIPVLSIGGHAVHIPYHTNWAHEKAERPVGDVNFMEIKSLSELEKILCI